jgi:hypothetical protein
MVCIDHERFVRGRVLSTAEAQEEFRTRHGSAWGGTRVGERVVRRCRHGSSRRTSQFAIGNTQSSRVGSACHGVAVIASPHQRARGIACALHASSDRRGVGDEELMTRTHGW